MRTSTPSWLKSAVFYQIYPQSFYDSNGDGIGDIPGIIDKLDYVQSLGVNALWINPCFVSPFRDAGYDVADYYKVAPRYGKNSDLIRLFKEAHRRNIRVCLDLVAGHTSVDHPWFRNSCSSEKSEFSERYIWTDSMWDTGDGSLDFIKGYGQRPGNVAVNFFWSQPALNYGFAKPDPRFPWQQPVEAPGPRATREELRNIMRYWLDKGADGFRADMAFSLVKNDPKRNATMALWQGIRDWMRAYKPEAVLIAEWGNPTEAINAGFDVDFMIHYGVPGYPSLFFNEHGPFGRGHCFFDPRGEGRMDEFLTEYMKQYRRTRRRGFIAIPSGNHDFQRPNTHRSVSDLKVIWTFLLTWPGIPFIYYGDEIGMRFLEGLPSKEGAYDRTGSRTPMQWSGAKNAGFSTAARSKLYLPVDPRKEHPTVEEQETNRQSLLHHVRHLVHLRKKHAALQGDGHVRPLCSGIDGYPFVYERQKGRERFVIVINPANRTAKAHMSTKDSTIPERLYARGVTFKKGRKLWTVEAKARSFGIFRAGGGKK